MVFGLNADGRAGVPIGQPVSPASCPGAILGIAGKSATAARLRNRTPKRASDPSLLIAGFRIQSCDFGGEPKRHCAGAVVISGVGGTVEVSP